MTRITRRYFVAGGTALAATPLISHPAGWQSVAQVARAFDQCHAILIHQNGAGVLSQVFRGPPIARSVPIKSVSKTLVAALTGAALDLGEIPSLSATLADLAPQLIPNAADPRVGAITIENLVTMQAGLERTSGANYGSWVSSANWVENALSRPFVRDPGDGMLYSTGSFHVLGAVLSEVSGKSLLSLARERLGEPLGIDFPPWTRDPQGRYLGGNEMALNLAAMVRFGEVYRMNGMRDGTQVLSEAWVSSSLQPKTRSRFSGLEYGYGWFLGQSQGAKFALARGYGGQIICIIPSLGITAAITSDPTRPARSGGYFGDLMDLIKGAIIPVALGA